MSKEIVSNGNDFVVEQVDRGYLGARKTVLNISGADGSATFGKMTVAKDGTITIAGAAISGGAITADTQISANHSLTMAAGTGSLDFSAGTGIFSTTSGTNTLNGNVVIAGSKTFTSGTGLASFLGDVLIADGKVVGFGASQALSGAGAVDVTHLVTQLTTTGTAQALTLADGTRKGQLKIVHHAVDGGSAVLTPTHAGNFATFTFTNVHDAALFQWNGTAWDILLNVGGTVA